MAFSENEPTKANYAPKRVDYAMVEDLSLYESAREQFIIDDHREYARQIANKFKSGLPYDALIEMTKFSIVKDHMDNALIANFLNDFLALELGNQQFDQYINLEDKI
jgi:hypothetical protein